MTNNTAGLEGITAGESAICTVGKQGVGLTYRGYAIEDLCAHASFEEVAYLLIYGQLPTRTELETYVARLLHLRKIPDTLKTVLKMIPKTAHPMDVLRTACSMLGVLEPEKDATMQYDIADRLLALFPAIICYWYGFHYLGQEIDENSQEKSLAGHFLALLLQNSPDPLAREMMNTSLILYAEHEFNASTFAARVTAATCADFYSAITSAIGTLRGPLHGGANEAAMALLERFDNLAEVREKLKSMLDAKAKIMGFGHRVYKKHDPRSDIIKQWSYRLANQSNNWQLYRISEIIEEVMLQEKGLYPNLDFYSASAYHYCAIPTFLFTPIFVMSRISGWAAHINEQRANNRLIRPSSDYIGPEPRAFVAIDSRI